MNNQQLKTLRQAIDLIEIARDILNQMGMEAAFDFDDHEILREAVDAADNLLGSLEVAMT